MEALRLLRPVGKVAPVDPLAVAPDPGAMTPLYINLRTHYDDGMTLAYAVPKENRPYKDIVGEYSRRCRESGFSDIDFWNNNFIIPDNFGTDIQVPLGMSLSEYIHFMRNQFIVRKGSRRGTSLDDLPYDTSVAGIGRFGPDSYGWDRYHQMKGYAADGLRSQIQNDTDNAEYQILQRGFLPNGTAPFLGTRPQLPYFDHEVRMMEEMYGPEALVKYLPAMEKEHNYWMTGKDQLSALKPDSKAHAYHSLVKMPDGSFLNRFWDSSDLPRFESLKEDVEHAQQLTDRLGLKGEAAERAKRQLWSNKRAAAAMGWDFSSRTMADGHDILTVNATEIIPIDLNSLLAYNMFTISDAYAELANARGPNQNLHLVKSRQYRQEALERIEAINKYLWDPEASVYRELNFVTGKWTQILSAAIAYPLYCGIANHEQTFGIAKIIEEEFLYPGGFITTTTKDSTEQWDGYNVWAPTNWAITRGLARMAHILKNFGMNVEYLFEIAEAGRANYLSGIETVYYTHGVVPEKHRGDDPTQLGGGGEYSVVKTLAMTAEIYQAEKAWEPRVAEGCLPIQTGRRMIYPAG